MKNVALGCLLSALVVLVAAPASAQLELPAPSPSAKVAQDVGVTSVSIDYSSPGVKGRKVWGDLVPWDKPWRSGANSATKITFSHDVTFGGKAVPAGTYSIVTLPSQKGWKVMLNKELGLFSSAAQYSPANDVATVAATTAAIPSRERLTYVFSNTTEDSTSLDLEWEKLRVSVPIKVDTATLAKANIEKAGQTSASEQAQAARYVADSTKDYVAALKLADASVALDSNWYNQWIRADILARSGKFAEARKAAQISWDLGEKDPNFFYKNQVSKALADWKNK
ncbi:DUF2911 domain-containing protein [Myxococcus sp. CA051A]|nr:MULTISPECIES: DUF2911 domain-containing protein [Myxococcus]NTX00151.1 DUF2911 domain-containing protein [Myxococcus sp. CA040A]NTX17229.1 DUF2911 domain-containing protein [Myxococcus sp. CA056]NTX38278.1 DUF2911 domain-containing protein [Myxococcus sp. CA033]NTX49711.1 DUF2911 domain-containing protein [Myxococcus sp. CA039A]NTX65485.1 DUF2911 domain-containing protein [Myxococcus sp. CA051A]